MRQKDLITISGKEKDFIELIHYDGSKLQVDLDDNHILAWYDYENNHEEWFLIDLKKELLIQYLSNKISLFDILHAGIVHSVQREYNDYNSLKRMRQLVSFNNYELPDKDALLGFDFTKEREYLNYVMKDYSKQNIYDVSKIEDTELNSEGYIYVDPNQEFEYCVVANDANKITWEYDYDAA